MSNETEEVKKTMNLADKKNYVAVGAFIQCSCGATFSALIAPTSHGVYIEKMAQMNINDNIPIINILPFGGCKVTKAPCVPVISMQWIGGKENTLIKGHPALLDTSRVMCALGGEITFCKKD